MRTAPAAHRKGTDDDGPMVVAGRGDPARTTHEPRFFRAEAAWVVIALRKTRSPLRIDGGRARARSCEAASWRRIVAAAGVGLAIAWLDTGLALRA
ncbi:hypothetical protein [Xanthomonas sp. XNM01]|uniref:hypothetical protein n=1 Tax=Xanthomonas sp. XNM01 TaxID=2769289 RepID=UPI00177C9D01|nr:hypothetical protein [Xanthomonas sp. XNM01]MBD9367763.1 hypothetical protein [Xanthomonas sp. XNM01]